MRCALLHRRHPFFVGVGCGGEDFNVNRVSRDCAAFMRFMHSFAQNMKYAVLQDSKGDMPEEDWS